MALRLAALDVGSNTIHVTVARIIKQGTDVERLADDTDLVRLGADVYVSGTIGAARTEHACMTIRRQVVLAQARKASKVLALATEAIRTAANGRELIERVHRETGVTLELISGQQEAALTYWGAVSGLKRPDARTVVIDMGGGSLEMAFGAGDTIWWRVSLPLGSRTIHMRYMFGGRANEVQVTVAERAVAEQLGLLRRLDTIEQVIVCGGTAATLAALANRLQLITNGNPVAQAGRRGKWLSRQHLQAALRMLVGTHAATMAEWLGVDEGRVHLLPAGAVVLLAVMGWLDVEEVRVRRRGVREGTMLAYARVGDRWLETATAGRLA